MQRSIARDRRLLKGTIIGIAGLGLLIGGGTFALWSDTISLPGGEIESGTLDLTLGTGGWTDEAGDPIADISAYLIVPGDEVTLTQVVTIEATGDTLTGTFEVDFGDLVGSNALADNLVTSYSVTSALQPGISGAGPYAITGDLGSYAATVEVSIELPATVGDTPGQTQLAQGLTVDFADIQFDLQQT